MSGETVNNNNVSRGLQSVKYGVASFCFCLFRVILWMSAVSLIRLFGNILLMWLPLPRRRS